MEFREKRKDGTTVRRLYLLNTDNKGFVGRIPRSNKTAQQAFNQC